MSYGVKSIIWFVLVFFIYVVGAELMADDSLTAEDNDSPTIREFAITKDGQDLNMEFSFNNVKGGLGKSVFTVGYIIKRNKRILESNVIGGLELTPDLSKVSELEMNDIFETGKFQAVVPWLQADDKETELEPGDTIKYLIFLEDGAGRKSNTVLHDFEFIEEWDI